MNAGQVRRVEDVCVMEEIFGREEGLLLRYETVSKVHDESSLVQTARRVSNWRDRAQRAACSVKTMTQVTPHSVVESFFRSSSGTRTLLHNISTVHSTGFLLPSLIFPMALPRSAALRGSIRSFVAKRTATQARTNLRNVGRRTYAQEHSTKKSSDLPW